MHSSFKGKLRPRARKILPKELQDRSKTKTFRFGGGRNLHFQSLLSISFEEVVEDTWKADGGRILPHFLPYPPNWLNWRAIPSSIFVPPKCISSVTHPPNPFLKVPLMGGNDIKYMKLAVCTQQDKAWEGNTTV